LAKNPKNKIRVITDKPDFQYYPTLYSSATGHSHLESWVPIGEIFAEHDNIHVFIDKIIGVDAKKQQLIGSSGSNYDYQTCIIAVGSVTTYFGIPGIDQYSYGIKSADEIRRLKERLYEDLAVKGELDRNYIVVGAGPTGVELSAALGTYIKKLSKYHGIKQPKVNIRLIEASPRVLPRSHEKISKSVHKRLEKLGVEVQVGSIVQKQTAESLFVSGRPLASHTVIWTSGVANNPLFVAHPDVFKLSDRGKVIIDDYMRAAKNIYVLGDNAATPYSGLAQTALHDAKFVAENFNRRREGKPMKKYLPILPASSIPVGRWWAVFEWRWIRLYGWPASVIRRVADLVGYVDILPIGQALRPWHAAKIYERDYFAPQAKRKKRK
jgi:NADH dehydrogenase